MNNKIVVSVTNDISTDQRVFKVCQSLQKMGFEVELIGRLNSYSKTLIRDYPTHRIKTFFLSGPLFYFEFNLRLYFLLMFKPCSVLLSNDLDTLSANYLASVLKNVPLVYDSHELFTEVPELMNRSFKKQLWQTLESVLLPRIKHSYTVCESIANFYKEKYGIQMQVVKNVPLKRPSFSKNKTKTIIFQGNMNPCRGIDLAIKSMKFLPDFTLKVIGNGPAFKSLKRLASHEGVSQNVVFFGRMDYDEIQKHTQEASVGILFEEPYGLSFKYSLPNKLFDYIHAKTPVLATPLVEVKKVMDQYPVGDFLTNRNPKKIAHQIKKIAENLDRFHFDKAIKELNWQKEEKVLESIFLQK